jgi:2-dehydro-3-deoxyphosphooctonate aldolase (KDO 8-P synthase)
MMMAEKLKVLTASLGFDLIFKASYDKANRTSNSGYRGMGIDQGLKIIGDVRTEFALPVISDIHESHQAEAAAKIVDILQIPAFLCRQTDLLEAAGRTGRAVMIKKGQFLHPADMHFAAEKIMAVGGKQILLCERGSSFGYRELIVDMRSLSVMREMGYPVVFDATHSVQVMGGAGGKSGGNRKYVSGLTRAAVAVGIDGLFIEVHNDPDSAPSDGPNMLPLDQIETLLRDVKKLSELSLETR